MKNKYITKDGFVRLDEEFWEKYVCIVDRGEWMICRRKGKIDSYVLGRWAEGRTRLCMASEVNGMRGLKSDGYGLVPLRFVWDMLDMDRARLEEEEEVEERSEEPEEERDVDAEIERIREATERWVAGSHRAQAAQAIAPETSAARDMLRETLGPPVQNIWSGPIIDQDFIDSLRVMERTRAEVTESQRGIRE